MDHHDNQRRPGGEPITSGRKRKKQLDAWMRLRGALKDVYAQLGGGEAYLLQERAEFNRAMEVREQGIERARRKSGRSS
ncbi:MAG: hypothetical protein WBQ09_01100 [Terriglobales bacterium]|jgi:hypothetical protein